MNLSTQPYKGARDFYPEEKRIQKWMFDTVRRVCEKYGYEEYDAPILEPTELFLSKGNEEIIKEQTYSFQDRGGRSVTVRTEMTPSVSRMVAGKRQELAYPVRWYSIPNLWRYERPQRGRGREFYQPNIDLFGVEGIEADHEMIMIANDILKSFGAKSSMYSIKINSRKFTNYFLHSYLGLDDVQAATIIRIIDRMHKVEPPEFQAMIEAALSPDQRQNGIFDKLMNVIKVGNIDELPEELKNHESISGITHILSMLEDSGISNAQFDITLMRGFDYYTDVVFEVFDTDPANNRSMFGGGRYDGLVTLFGVESVPAVGFALGDITLQNFLESHSLLPNLSSEINVCVVLVGDIYKKSLKIFSRMREEGVNVYVDISNRKPDKQLKNVLKKNCQFVMFIGEKELEEEMFSLKDLVNNEESQLSLDRIISTVLAK